MMMLRPSFASFVTLTLSFALAAPAFAQDDDEAGKKKETSASAEDFQRVEERAPRLGTPLIANKLYPMSLRFEITGFFDYSFNDKYVQHTGGSGGLTFHIFDSLALEGFGGYLVGDETGIVSNVRNDGSSAKKGREAPDTCENALCEPQLPDMYQTTWFAGADVQWAPIYGKISAVSEYDLNFQLYALAGGGAEGITRLLNDLQFYEFAEALASRVLKSSAKTDAERIENAFRLCLSRTPSATEKQRLQQLLTQQLAQETGDENARRAETWKTLARVLLNLDEMITRE